MPLIPIATDFGEDETFVTVNFAPRRSPGETLVEGMETVHFRPWRVVESDTPDAAGETLVDLMPFALDGAVWELEEQAASAKPAVTNNAAILMLLRRQDWVQSSWGIRSCGAATLAH